MSLLSQLRDVSLGLVHLHSQDIIHGDLKAVLQFPSLYYMTLTFFLISATFS